MRRCPSGRRSACCRCTGSGWLRHRAAGTAARRLTLRGGLLWRAGRLRHRAAGTAAGRLTLRGGLLRRSGRLRHRVAGTAGRRLTLRGGLLRRSGRLRHRAAGTAGRRLTLRGGLLWRSGRLRHRAAGTFRPPVLHPRRDRGSPWRRAIGLSVPLVGPAPRPARRRSLLRSSSRRRYRCQPLSGSRRCAVRTGRRSWACCTRRRWRGRRFCRNWTRGRRPVWCVP